MAVSLTVSTNRDSTVRNSSLNESMALKFSWLGLRPLQLYPSNRVQQNAKIITWWNRYHNLEELRSCRTLGTKQKMLKQMKKKRNEARGCRAGKRMRENAKTEDEEIDGAASKEMAANGVDNVEQGVKGVQQPGGAGRGS